MRVHTRIGNHETAQFNEIVFSKIVSRDDLNLPLDLNDLFYVAVLLMNSQQEAHNHLHVAFLGSHLQIANAALQASGYRTLTSKPGHHQVMIQSLSKTLGIILNKSTYPTGVIALPDLDNG
jgi:hypothetical protein